MNDQLPVINQYPTGAAGLFASHARQVAEVVELIVVTCWRCLSDDTELVDHGQQIYRCQNCGELFERPTS